jgi:hypothetical protein
MKAEDLLSTISMEIHVKAQTYCVISSTDGEYYVYRQFDLITLDKLCEMNFIFEYYNKPLIHTHFSILYYV